MQKYKLLFISINIILLIILQSVFQAFIQIKGNSLILLFPLSISMAIYFDFWEGLISNIIFSYIFCNIFLNEWGIILTTIVVMTMIINLLKEKIYIERIEIFILALGCIEILINMFYFTIAIFLNGSQDVNILVSNIFIRFILDSISGIFFFKLIQLERKHLINLKKGRNVTQ